MCLYPKIIENRKYIANKKNKGIVPIAKDKRVLYVPVGCGKCIECKKQKARSWQVRLQEEIRHDNKGKFITLTFSDESIQELIKSIKGIEGYELDNEIATLGVRRFLERWRKKYKKSVKHWFVTELGQTNTERIHIHGIIWTNVNNEKISELWKYGMITIGKSKYLNGKRLDNNNTGYVNEKTINYIVKYVNKIDIKHENYNSKILTSPGIGKDYIKTGNNKKNRFKGNETDERYTTRQGIKLNLPIYYRNHTYTEEEREKLWLQKLDDGTRYICGEKIEKNTSEENYYKTLEYYRKLNKELGYGNDEKDWEKIRYENNRRNLIKLTQLKNKNKN